MRLAPLILDGRSCRACHGPALGKLNETLIQLSTLSASHDEVLVNMPNPA